MSENSYLRHVRRSYNKTFLLEDNIHSDPFAQFQSWFAQVTPDDFLEPNAMTLATADEQGKPSARIVLLKGFSTEGFQFFTNYTSRKGKDLEQNDHGALLFYWDKLEKQVRIEGRIAMLDKEESTSYFHSRPRGSQIGAWSSPQSQIIKNRDQLEKLVDEKTKEFDQEKIIPKPDFWGGYALLPSYFEFWQGRQNRLHDRICYKKLDNNEVWEVYRIAP